MERLLQMQGMQPRVHAAAFGYSEPEHVLGPLRLMDADAFFLLERTDDRAYKHHMDGGVDVHERLNDSGVPWKRIEVDIWRPAAVGNALRNVCSTYKLERLNVNASVGPNTVAVGATLASLFAPIRLFHPGGDHPEDPLQRLADVRWLPTMHVRGWTDRHITLLTELDRLGGETTGAKLKDALRTRDESLIGPGRGVRNWSQKEHARFQALMEFLKDADALEYQASRRRWDIQITESGREMAELLGSRA